MSLGRLVWQAVSDWWRSRSKAARVYGRVIVVDGYDIVVVKGVSVSTALFEHFKTSAQRGVTFRFVSNIDGVVTLETVIDNRNTQAGV